MSNTSRLHALWLFDAAGATLFYREWYRPRNLLATDLSEDAKFIFGIVFSLDMLAPQLAPEHDASREAGFRRYVTPTYALHHLATLSGLHWVIMTSPAATKTSQLLDALYEQAYVPHIALNAHVPMGGLITSEAFQVEVDRIAALYGVQARGEVSGHASSATIANAAAPRGT